MLTAIWQPSTNRILRTTNKRLTASLVRCRTAALQKWAPTTRPECARVSVFSRRVIECNGNDNWILGRQRGIPRGPSDSDSHFA